MPKGNEIKMPPNDYPRVLKVKSDHFAITIEPVGKHGEEFFRIWMSDAETRALVKETFGKLIDATSAGLMLAGSSVERLEWFKSEIEQYLQQCQKLIK